jgi:hypothetical protein
MATDTKLPISFWIIGVLVLIWNAMGVMAFFADINQTPEDLAKLGSAMQSMYESRPAWALGAFAVAVFAGLAASVLLLMRRSLATNVFILSLAAVLVQQLYSFGIAKVQDIGGSEVLMFPALIVIIEVFCIWYSKSCTKKGWLS